MLSLLDGIMARAPRLRMLITTDCFLPRWDGISRFLSEILPSLSQEYDVTVLAPDFGRHPQNFDAKVIKFPTYGWKVGDISIARPDTSKIAKLVKESDIVFNQTLGPIGIHAVRRAIRHKVPVIAYIHSIDWDLFSNSIKHCKGIVRWGTMAYQRRIYNRCRLLLVSSSEVARTFENAGITTPKKVVRLGVNITRFCPPQSKEKAKRDIGLNPRHVIIGFSGRVGREKDVPTLKRAFEMVRKDHPNTRLLIVGSGVPEEERKIAGDDVVMPGMAEDVVPYLQAMDIFALPSLTETSSLATMEAMACGVPVISTPVGSVREYVEPGISGFFFPKRNSKTLAHRLSILIGDPSLRSRMGKAARQTAIKRFRWFETTREIKKTVAEVMKVEEI